MASILLLFSMLQGSFLEIHRAFLGEAKYFCIASSHPTARLSLWFAAQKYPGTLETCSASSWDLHILPWAQFRDFCKLRRSDILIDQIHKSYLHEWWCSDTCRWICVQNRWEGRKAYWNGALITQSAQYHLFLAWFSGISWPWSRDFRKRQECGRACLKCDRPTSARIFLTDWYAWSTYPHGEKCHVFLRYFNNWPSTSRLCSANHLRCTGAWGCKLIKQGTSQRFSKETCTPRNILDFAYVRNDFDVLTMLIEHWEPERRKTFQQVLAKHIPYSVIYSRSSSEVEMHLHIVSPRSTFGIFMTQEPTEGFKRWSNGLWDGIGASWCQWSDPMGVENWHDKYISGRKTRDFPLQMKPIESWNCSAYHCDNFMVMRGPMVASCSDPGTTTTRQIATGWHHSLTSSVRTY